jgi:hypothetical protein
LLRPSGADLPSPDIALLEAGPAIEPPERFMFLSCGPAYGRAVTRPVDVDVRPASSGAPIVDTITEPVAAPPAAWRLRLTTAGVVLLLAALSVLARVPSMFRPLSPDEGGFLMVAAQWAKGTSLYGDYWVDRPPLLIMLFQLAHLTGRPIGLRLLGAACVGSSVLLAAALARAALRLEGRHARGSRAAVIGAAATAAVFLVNPLFGATEVDGELLAVPFVLAGLTAALTAYRSAYSATRGATWWWMAAGALAVAAAAVKQNMLEVFVAAAVLLLAIARRSLRTSARSATAFGAGSAVCTLALLGWAALHGTTPAGIWDAVVSFRLEASSVIAHSAPDTTHARALGVAGAFLGSGALGIALAALVPRWHRRGPRPSTLLLSVTVAVLAWESISVVAGGSYWLHYLVATVPGLVLAAATAAERGRGHRIALGAVLGYAGAVAAAGIITMTLAPVGTPAADLAVERYLAAHSRPGDTGVIAFGDPALLEAAHLSSPYPELWSLPVRVRDPHLTDFASVLTGPDRPTWVVVHGDSLDTWGVDASHAQPVLERDYQPVHTDGDWHVYRVRTQPQTS